VSEGAIRPSRSAGTLLLALTDASAMEFAFTNTQEMIRDELRAFVEERIIGENLHWDDAEQFPTEGFDTREAMVERYRTYGTLLTVGVAA